MDPYAAAFSSISPNDFSGNNPIMFNDPSGGIVNDVGALGPLLSRQNMITAYTGYDGMDAGCSCGSGGGGNSNSILSHQPFYGRASYAIRLGLAGISWFVGAGIGAAGQAVPELSGGIGETYEALEDAYNGLPPNSALYFVVLRQGVRFQMLVTYPQPLPSFSFRMVSHFSISENNTLNL